MSKKKKSNKLLKPRDPAFLEMIKKKQGAHNESKKAIRARGKANLKKQHYDQAA